MSSPAVDLLLLQAGWGTVEPDRYSRLSTFGRVEPLLRTSGLALAAVLSGIVLGAAGRPAARSR